MIINESQSTEQHPHLPIGCSVHGGGSPCVPLYRCQFCARGYPASDPWPISCRSVFWLLLCSCKKTFCIIYYFGGVQFHTKKYQIFRKTYHTLLFAYARVYKICTFHIFLLILHAFLLDKNATSTLQS